MNKYKVIISRYYIEIVLLVLMLIVYFPWLNFQGTLVAGDWEYHYVALLKGFFQFPQIWQSYNNIGGVDLLPTFDPLKYLYGALSHIVSYGITERILYFLPTIIFSYLGVVKFGRYVFGKDNIAFFAFSIIYLFNTFVLSVQTSFITYAVVYALSPLVVLKLFKLLKTPNIYNSIVLGLLLFICSIYEPRGLIALSYLISLILIFKLILFKVSIKELYMCVFTYIILIILNTYWIIAIVFAGSGLNATTTQTLFAAYTTLTDALFLHSYAWQGNIFTDYALIPFKRNAVSIYFTIVPIISFCGIFIKRHFRHNTYAIYIAALSISVIGIFLLKQQNQPLGYLYELAFKNLPSFSVFRESNKFILFMLPIAVCYALSVSNIHKYIRIKSFKLLFLCIAILIPLINLKPILTKEISTLFVNKDVPNNYSLINKIIGADNSYYRTLWVPNVSTWSISSNLHPALGQSDLLNNQLPQTYSVSGANTAEVLTNNMKSSFAKYLFDNLSVKYVIVPPKDAIASDDIYINYGGDRQAYVDALDSITWLKKIQTNNDNVSIYRNDSYNQPITVATELYKVDSTYQLGSLYNFNSNALGQNSFAFTSYPTSLKHIGRISDLFAGNKISIPKPGVLNANASNTGLNQTIYFNVNHRTLSYINSTNNLKLMTAKVNNLNINNISTNMTSKAELILNKQLDSLKKYYIKNGNNIVKINNNSNKYLGSISANPVLYSTSGANIFPNSGLKKNLWKNHVENCGLQNSNDLINMSLDRDSSRKGINSLQLATSGYTACTGPQLIKIQPNVKNYLLKFNYKSVGTKQAGYIIRFNNTAKTADRQILSATDKWTEYSKLVEIPLGATQLSIKYLGYPDDQLRNITYTNYDNFSLSPLTVENTISIKPDPSYIKLPLNSNDTITYQDSKYSFENLIPNPSLENGLWQRSVGDCNKHDNDARIGSKLITSDHSDGRKSLQLEATTHIACTGPNAIPVKENTKVSFSFDYASSNAKNAAYYISYDDPLHTTITQQINITDSKWHTYNKSLLIPNGANNLRLLVYSYSSESQDIKISTKYDNFKLIEIPDIESDYFLVSNQNPYIKSSKIDIKSLSAANKQITIQRITSSFYINFNEAYNSKWQLIYDNRSLNKDISTSRQNSNVISSKNHYVFNDYGNGWYVDINDLCAKKKVCLLNKDGSYNLTINAEFIPQKYFKVGIIVSCTSLVVCILYVLVKPQRFKGWRDASRH